MGIPILVGWSSKGASRWLPTTVRNLDKDEEFLEEILAGDPYLLGLQCLPADCLSHIAVFRQLSIGSPTDRSLTPDIIILTDDGHVVLVEVKLADNPELRDKRVVGQVVTYTASLSLYSEDELRDLFATETSACATWEETVASMFPRHADPCRLAATLLERIRRAQVFLVIACDMAPPGVAELVRAASRQSALGDYELRLAEITPFVRGENPSDIIFAPSTYLSTNTVSRTAVTVTYEGYQEAGVRVPHVQVSTTSAEAIEDAMASTGSRPKWDEPGFLQQIDGSESQRTVLDLLSFAKNSADEVTWGTGKATASFSYRVACRDRRLAMFSVNAAGGMALQLGQMLEFISKKEQAEFMRRVAEIPGFEKLRMMKPGNIYPNFDTSALGPKAHMDTFCRAVLDFQRVIAEAGRNK